MEIEHNVELFRGTTAEWQGSDGQRLIERGQIAFNKDTGEMRVGPGTWGTCKPIGAEFSLEVQGIVQININIATGLNNSSDTIAGAPVIPGKTYLLVAQSNAAENGPWVAGTTPARHADYATYDANCGILFRSQANGNLFKCVSPSGGTINSTALNYSEVAGGSLRFAEAGPATGVAHAIPTLASKVLFYDATGTLKYCTVQELYTTMLD